MTYKGFSVSLMGVITGLLCFFAILLSTPWGTQLSLFAVNHLTPIQVKYRSGALLNDLRLAHVVLLNEQAHVRMNEVFLQLHLRCLWRRQLCVDELSIASLSVEVNTNNQAQDTEIEVHQAPLRLPFRIKVDKFSVAKAQVKSPTAAVALSGFASALSVDGTNIHIGTSQLNTAQIQLMAPVQANSPQQPTPNATTDWPLAHLPTLYLPLNVTVSGFNVNKLMISKANIIGEANTRFTFEQTLARLSWFKSALSIKELSSTMTPLGDFSVSGKMNLVAPYTLDVAIASQINQVDAPVQLNDSSQKITLKGGLADLNAHIESEGALALTADLTVNAVNENLPYQFSLDATQFIVLDDVASVMNPSTLRLNSRGDRFEHTLNLSSVMTGLGYQDALLELDGIYRQQQLTINALQVQEPQANNQLDAKGEVSFGAQYTWNVDINSTGFTLPTIRPEWSGRVEGNIQSSGFWQPDSWAINLNDSKLSGEINGINFTSTAHIQLDHQGRLSDSQLAVRYGDSSLTLTGYSDDNWHVTGKIDIGHLGQWQPNAEGQYTAALAISGALAQPEIAMQGLAKHLRYLEANSEQIIIKANYRPYNNHGHDISINTPAMTWDKHAVEQANVELNGDFFKQSLRLDWTGDSSLSLLLDGEYSPTDKTWHGQTNRVTATLDKQVLTSDQPIAMSYKQDSHHVEINSHCWRGDDVDVCLTKEATFTPDEGELAFDFEFDSVLIKPFLPDTFELTSLINGQLNLGWEQGHLSILNADVMLSEGEVKIKKDGVLHQLIHWQNGKANIALEQGLLVGNLGVFSSEHSPILEANTRLTLANKQWQDSHIVVHDFNLATIQPLIPDLSVLEGQITTNVTLSGAFEHPNIQGSATLKQGQAQLVGNMNTLTNMNMLFDFNGQGAAITGDMLLNQDGLNVSGDAYWQDSFLLDLNIDGQSLNLSVPPELAFTASPHLNAKITTSGVNLTGRIEVHDGKLTVDKLPQGKVTLSKDVIIVNDDGEQMEHDTAFDISTDIRLVIADVFQVEGQGFNGQLGGELQVTQRANQPLQLFGRLNFPSGRYRAYGQDLSLSKGIVSFNGPVNNPYVTLQATRQIEKENIIVGIDATGLANGLNIKLFSKPHLQQAEILSYLVRGRGMDAETSNSNAALGVALGTAVTNYSGVLSQIEKLPLINRIEVDGDEKQVSIAGYLGDQVYIKYGIGVIEPINELTVRFYLLSRLWVEAVSGLESSADLYYSFEID